MGQAKRRKAEIEELKKHTKYFVYHGTTEAVAQKLLAGEGLIPRGDRPSMWQHTPSRSDCVYLTNFYGVKYASDMQTNTLVHGSKPVRGAVVEIDMNKLDQANLLADEDYMAKMHMATDPHRVWVQAEWIELEKHYATHDEGAHEAWNDSLTHYGTVAHRGEIPREAITRIALITIEWLGGLRYGEMYDEELWKIHANPKPDTLTNTQRFQKQLTHMVFEFADEHIEDFTDEHIEVITLSSGLVGPQY